MSATLPTYYDVLRVERDETADGIRRAYRRLAQKYHPDKMPCNDKAQRAMAAINAAYEVLSDADRRAEHDRWIRRAENPVRPLHPVSAAPAGRFAFLNPVTNWPWYLLFATMAFAMGTIGTAVFMAARVGA